MPPNIFGAKDMIETWIHDFMNDIPTFGDHNFRIRVYLEATNQIPFRPRGNSGKTGQGLASTAKFSKSVGRLEGLLCGMGLDHRIVSPQKWMRALDCMTKGDKRITRNLAIKMYPKLKPILICHYGEMLENA